MKLVIARKKHGDEVPMLTVLCSASENAGRLDTLYLVAGLVPDEKYPANGDSEEVFWSLVDYGRALTEEEKLEYSERLSKAVASWKDKLQKNNYYSYTFSERWTGKE
jgi:hypothetical protein